MKITWLGHDVFLISSGDKRIYIDPYQIPAGLDKADIILLTHTHYDHTSMKDIDKIKKESTQFVTTADSEITENIHVMGPGDKERIGDLSIEAVPAYNIDKKFHPKEKNWVGYIVTVEGKSIYHAGDTDFIPEMSRVVCDIALLPVGGTYTMTAEQAVEAVRKIKPKLAIPIHYGSFIGSSADAQAFKEKSEQAGIKVQILKKNESIEV